MSSSDKLLAVFGLFTVEEPEWTVEAAAERLGLATSTTYRFFRSLSNAGLISAFTTGRYVLGPAIVELDRQTRLLDPLMKVARPVMREVVAELDLPGVMLLCRLFRNQVMCIHQEYVDLPLSAVSYERGRPLPLYRGAPSKAILAFLPARFVRTFYEGHRDEMIVAGFPTQWEEVKVALRRLRVGRLCVTSGELDPGITGIATPLRDLDGSVNASLTFVLTDSQRTEERMRAIGEVLRRAAEKVETELARAAEGLTESGASEHLGDPDAQ